MAWQALNGQSKHVERRWAGVGGSAFIGLARKVVAGWAVVAAICLTTGTPARAADAKIATTQPAVTEPGLGQEESSERAPDQDKPTDAEKIARLQRSIDGDTRVLQDLREKLNAPDSEYAQAEREFTSIDGHVERTSKELEQHAASQPQETQDTLQAELRALETKHKLAKDRFDLAIRERKVLQEQVATLEKKVQQDQAALRKLKGEPDVSSSQPAGTAAAEAEGSAATQPAAVLPSPAADQKAARPTVAPGGDSAATTPIPAPVQDAAATTGEGAITTPAGKAPLTPELEKARAEAAAKQAQAHEAAKEASSVSERMDAARKAIALEQTLLQTARERADNARQTERTLYEELQTNWQAGASHEQLSELRKKIAEARSRSRETEQEIRERTDRISKRQEELSSLQAEQIAALEQVEQTKQDAESAQKRVEQIENPLSPRNLLRWLIEHGPRVLGIILGMVALLWVSRLMEGRIVRLMSGRCQHGTSEDRENRARTLVGVFRSAAAVAIYTGGTLMILTEFGVNIVPLLGGAAVLGLAVAFGAQNLIRDYFSGFMILLENQYTINDVVKLGDIAGQVENITLRITVLRGLDGTVHFVPNGQITQVSNMTHGWSRALFEIPVSYNEDVDRVMQVLIDLGKELRRDPDFRGMILEMPEMLGVDAFGDSAVVIKFFMKTRPLKQWTVKREMLRRIKRKFDELGIEIPFPHRTVYHRLEDGNPLADLMEAWAAGGKGNGNK